MMRQRTYWLLPILLLLLCAGPAPGQQQEEDPPPPEGSGSTEAEAPQQGLEPQGGAESDFTSNIEQILEEDEAVMTGSGYTYDSAGRRDPFKSLVQNRRNAVTRQGPRPEGKAGLLIDEVSLTGVFQTPEGSFAQVQGGPKNKSYLLQAGDQLYDGDVVEVGREEIVFKQLINDPTAITPFREVVKRLSTD